MKKKICSALTAISLCVGLFTGASAAGISYLPNVTADMSDASYWSKDSSLLMTVDEIEALNALSVAEKDTHMYDLKNHAEIIDGVSLNSALLSSSKADADYYLGWTYIDGSPATEESFMEFINNTQNPNPQKEQQILYGIAVKRTHLRAFPSPRAIGDDPNDKDFDYQYLSSIRVNEPVVITSISNDGKYYLAKNICCSGWIPTDSVAICKDKAQWLSAWDIAPENTLVVYGDKVYTEYSNTAAETSSLMLTMGTVLETADPSDPNVLIDNRAAYQNYVVWLPTRNTDGSYGKKLTLISEHNKVSLGYLPLTKENIAKVAFSALGNTYGWGGSLLSDDCSGYIRNIYKCFGLELARNTVWQTAMPMARSDMRYMCREERAELLDSLPIGSILYFNGHEMLYLGKENGKYYVVSSISTIMQPENPAVRQRIRSIVINTTDIKRASGNSWLDELTDALIPYQTAENSTLPKYKWYHDGVAYCLENKLMQGDENNRFNPDSNVTRAELLQILWNREGKPTDNITPSDTADSWYSSAVNWASSTGLIGESDIDYETDITRQQLATVLFLYAKYKGADTNVSFDISVYTDASEVSEYAVSAMEYAAANGLINGKSEKTINPNDCTTRAEIAVILYRFANLNK